MRYSYKNTRGETKARTVVKDVSFEAVKNFCIKNNIKYAVCTVDDAVEGKNLLVAVDSHDGEYTIDFAYDFLGNPEDKPRILYHTLEDTIKNHISYISDDVIVVEQNGSRPMVESDAFEIYSFAFDEVTIARMTADHIGPIGYPNIYSYTLERFLKDEGIMYSKLTSKNSQVHYFSIGVALDGCEEQSLTMTLCFSNEVQLTSFAISDISMIKSEDDYDNSLFDTLEVFDGDPLNILIANDIINMHVINNFSENLRYTKVRNYLSNNEFSHAVMLIPDVEYTIITADLNNGMAIRMAYKDNHYQLKKEPDHFEANLASFSIISENAIREYKYYGRGVETDYFEGKNLDANALTGLLNGIN